MPATYKVTYTLDVIPIRTTGDWGQMMRDHAASPIEAEAQAMLMLANEANYRHANDSPWFDSSKQASEGDAYNYSRGIVGTALSQAPGGTYNPPGPYEVMAAGGSSYWMTVGSRHVIVTGAYKQGQNVPVTARYKIKFMSSPAEYWIDVYVTVRAIIEEV